MRLLLVPALNEATALESFHSQTQQLLNADVIDDVVLADGGSTDGTVELALDLGYTVNCTGRAMHAGQVLGKGDNVFRAIQSLNMRDDDTLLLLDMDVRLATPLAVGGMIERLSADTSLVKADFVRVDADGRYAELRGGRVTELTARPLLAQHALRLACLGQPLSGQVVARFVDLRRWPYYSHYALEITMLLAAATTGAVAEVYIGELQNPKRGDAHLANVASDAVDGFFMFTTGAARPGSRVRRLNRSYG